MKYVIEKTLMGVAVTSDTGREKMSIGAATDLLISLRKARHIEVTMRAHGALGHMASELRAAGVAVREVNVG